MKKLAVLIVLICGCSFARAATYYACSAGNVNGSIWYTSTACTSPTTLPTLNNGDILESNNFAVALNVAVGSSGTVITLQNTAGGSFTYATASNLTFYINGNCTTSTASDYLITTSGTTGGGTFNGTFTGGAVTNCQAVRAGQATVNLTFTNATGGSGSSANGIYAGASGSGGVTITGLAQPGSGASGVNVANGSATFTGTIYGSNSAAFSGCSATAAGGCIISNAVLWNGTHNPAVVGYEYFTSTAATSYVVFPINSSYTLGTLNANAVAFPVNPAAANVRSSVVYGPFTGSYGGSCTAAVSTGCW